MARPRRSAPATDAYRELARRYASYREAHGYAARSSRHEGYRVGEFLAWLEGRGVTEVAAVTPALVGAYAEHLASRPKHDDGSGRVTGALSAGSVGRHWAAVRGALAMLHHAGELVVDPASGVAVAIDWAADEVAGGAVLTQGEVQSLYACTQRQTERAVLALGYGCGLRIAEAAALDVGAVRFGGGAGGCGSVTVERGKGGRRRVVPLAPGVRDDLADYYYGERAELEELGGGYESALMLNARGGRMRTWTLARELSKVVARAVTEGRLEAASTVGAASKRVTFHGLRHAVASHLLERGLTLEQVRRFLGHRHAETTETYTHVSAAMLGELVAS